MAAPPDDVTTDAVVCAVVPYSDDDAVVRLMTRLHGRVGAFARKARASKRRFPALTAPSIGRARLRPRRSGDLWELLELDVEPVVLGLGNDARALGHAAYLAELVERLVPEAEPAPELFDAVNDGIRHIARSGASALLLRAVELKLLHLLGYLPPLVVVDVPGASCEAYDPVAGRLLHAPTAASVPFSQAALELAQQLFALSLVAPMPVADAQVLRATSRLFAAHLRRQGGAPLRSIAFLRALPD